MKLTEKTRWRYNSNITAYRNIKMVRERDEWLSIVLQLIPDRPLRYLELGCAPGLYTAALAEGTKWEVSGIDYSDDAETFIKMLTLIGKSATLYKGDIFNHEIKKSFDIVASFGLVEHFRGTSLDEVLTLHDKYTEEGGYVIIEMPNFTGFQYFWHYIFDRPDLDNHNVDVMQPSAMQWFESRGYEILFNDYVGPMRLWGNSGWVRFLAVGKMITGIAVLLSKLARGLDAIGIQLRGRTWSPDFLMIARKKHKH